MHTLHIEHAVTDFATWNTAFGTFADQRQRSGVRHQRVQRPLNDSAYVVIDLDFDTWNTAFGTFADQRQRSGVRHQRVQRPLNDPAYVVIDLDFDTASEAANFLGFLQANVWRSPGSAPALVGTPQTRILELTQPSSRDVAAPTAT